MRLSRMLALVVSVLAPIAGAACGDDSPAASDGGELTFRSEASPLRDFSFDTGLVPPASPVQISLKLAAGGKMTVVATGTKTPSGVTGKPGGGTFSLDLHATMAGRLKIDTPLKKADEELPGLKNIDVPIAGNVTFDPFLVEDGQSASLTAAVPETKLPPIPLGSVPGKLELTVTKDSQITSVLRGRCMSVAGEQASYRAEATTRGKLVLKGTVLVELPAPLGAPVDIGTIEVPIPESTTVLDSGPVPASGVADATQGSACERGLSPGPDPSSTDGGARDAGDAKAPLPVGTYRGTLASTAPTAFGGGAFCYYSVVLRDVEVMLTEQGGIVLSGEVKNRVEERLVKSCPYPAAAPSAQRFDFASSTATGDLFFTPAATNQPKAALTASWRWKVGGDIEARLTWRRTDVEPALNWEVNASVLLVKQ